MQAVGNVDIDVKELGVNMLSMSAHKIYGPKGQGALYVKKGVHISGFIHGGAQEMGKRAGTENLAGIVGFGKAAELAKVNLEDRKSTRLNSSHMRISYAVFCLKKKKNRSEKHTSELQSHA